MAVRQEGVGGVGALQEGAAGVPAQVHHQPGDGAVVDGVEALVQPFVGLLAEVVDADDPDVAAVAIDEHVGDPHVCALEGQRQRRERAALRIGPLDVERDHRARRAAEQAADVARDHAHGAPAVHAEHPVAGLEPAAVRGRPVEHLDHHELALAHPAGGADAGDGAREPLVEPREVRVGQDHAVAIEAPGEPAEQLHAHVDTGGERVGRGTQRVLQPAEGLGQRRRLVQAHLGRPVARAVVERQDGPVDVDEQPFDRALGLPPGVLEHALGVDGLGVQVEPVDVGHRPRVERHVTRARRRERGEHREPDGEQGHANW